MPNFTEADSFDATVGQIADGQQVSAANDNPILQAIVNRTRWLYNKITASNNSLVGMCASFPSSVPPTGWLERDGTLKNRVDYPALWAFAQASGNLAVSDALWTTGQFSPGNGTTTFRLMDDRGTFDRNWDHGRGIDAGRTLGSNQQDALQNITGQVGIVSGGVTASGAFAVDGSPFAHINTAVSGTDPAVTFDASRVARTATETRPINNAKLACIKY